MEDLCWDCVSASHHRRDCKAPKNSDLRREIQRAHKKGGGLERHMEQRRLQLEKMKAKQKVAFTTELPPLAFFSKEIDRLDQLLYDIRFRKEAIPQPVGSVSADCLEDRLTTVNDMREVLAQELEMIRLIGALKLAYKLTDANESDSILVSKIENVKEAQADLSNDLHSIYTALNAAIGAIKDVDRFQNELQQFVNRGLEAYSGRPLYIPEIKREWQEKKKLVCSAQDLIKKYAYLFCEDDRANLKRKIASIMEGRTLLKSMKKEYEKEIPKILCKMCYEVDVDHAIIPCGHTYCSKCIGKLRECGICRGRIQSSLKLYF